MRMGLCSLNFMPAKFWPNSKDIKRRKVFTWLHSRDCAFLREVYPPVKAGSVGWVTTAEGRRNTTLLSSTSFSRSMEFGMKLPSFYKTRIPICVRSYRCRLALTTRYEI